MIEILFQDYFKISLRLCWDYVHFVTVLNIKYRVSCILIIPTTKTWILKKAVQSLSPQPVSHSFILIVEMNHSHSF